MKFLKTDNSKITVCVRKEIVLVGETEKGLINYPYKFNFCGVIDLPFEPTLGDLISYNQLQDLGVVKSRKIYSEGASVILQFPQQVRDRLDPNKDTFHNLELSFEKITYHMWGKSLEENPIEDIHRLWLTLLDIFDKGLGMERHEFHRFQEFNDKWYPEFENKGLV